MKRAIVVATLSAMCVGGCSKTNSKTGSNTATAGSASGASSGGTTAIGDSAAKALALAFVAHLAAGRFDAAAKMLSKRMGRLMPAAKLGSAWKQISTQFGAFQRVVATVGRTVGKAHTYSMTAKFAKRPLGIIVSIGATGRVSGLFFRPAKLPHPKYPKPPYPYLSRDVVFVNKTDHTKHAGTLTTPKGKGPFPAALLISGSGLQDRDETILQHKPFLVLADHLTRAGFAVLRVDDRGVGGSGGDPKKMTLPIEATDVEAGIDFLAAQKNIDRKAIGLIGHSTGGAVAPMVASRRADVAFVVSLAGSALSGDKIVVQQVIAAVRGKPGMTKDKLDKLLAAQKAVMAAAKTGSQKKLLPALKKAMAVATSIGAQRAPPPGAAKAQVAQLLSPWFQSFLKTDPAAFWAKVKKAHVLALDGTKDTQVVATQNLPAITAALKRAHNKDVTIKALPGLNHLFLRCKTGEVTEYATITSTFDSGALDLITQWLTKRFPPHKG